MQEKEWYQLVNMFNRGAIVSGNVEAITTIERDNKKENAVVMFYGDCRIIVPISAMDLIDVNEGEELSRTLLRGMLGAKLDCIITELNEKESTVYASRKKANEVKRKMADAIEVGSVVKVNVTGVGRVEAIVEFNGFQAKVGMNEIAWGRIYDIRDYIKVGDKIDMQVMNITEENGEVKFELSSRVLKDDPFQKYVEDMKFYTADSEYKGVIREIKNTGIFVELRPGITALCNFPNWQRFNPQVGQDLCVMIKRIKHDKKLIDGVIIREL